MLFYADECAIIDEIQMMRDCGRGWAWTRAFLGLPAKEIHICGEAAAIDLVTLPIICSTFCTGQKDENPMYKHNFLKSQNIFFPPVTSTLSDNWGNHGSKQVPTTVRSSHRRHCLMFFEQCRARRLHSLFQQKRHLQSHSSPRGKWYRVVGDLW